MSGPTWILLDCGCDLEVTLAWDQDAEVGEPFRCRKHTGPTRVAAVAEGDYEEWTWPTEEQRELARRGAASVVRPRRYLDCAGCGQPMPRPAPDWHISKRHQPWCPECQRQRQKVGFEAEGPRCGHPTQAGTPCKTRVKEAGELCWNHQNAMEWAEQWEEEAEELRTAPAPLPRHLRVVRDDES